MKKYVVTVFNLRTHGLQKVNIVFADGVSVTLEGVIRKVENRLGPASYIIIAWSPVDEFSF